MVLAHDDRQSRDPGQGDGHGADPEHVPVHQIGTEAGGPQAAQAASRASTSHSFRSGPCAARTRTVRRPSSTQVTSTRPWPTGPGLQQQHGHVVTGGDRPRLVAHEDPRHLILPVRETRWGA